MKKAKETINWITDDASIEERREYYKQSTIAKEKYLAKQKHKLFLKTFFRTLSNIILWICAVGGFVLALIQFLFDSPFGK